MIESLEIKVKLMTIELNTLFHNFSFYVCLLILICTKIEIKGGHAKLELCVTAFNRERLLSIAYTYLDNFNVISIRG